MDKQRQKKRSKLCSECVQHPCPGGWVRRGADAWLWVLTWRHGGIPGPVVKQEPHTQSAPCRCTEQGRKASRAGLAADAVVGPAAAGAIDRSIAHTGNQRWALLHSGAVCAVANVPPMNAQRGTGNTRYATRVAPAQRAAPCDPTTRHVTSQHAMPRQPAAPRTPPHGLHLPALPCPMPPHLLSAPAASPV